MSPSPFWSGSYAVFVGTVDDEGPPLDRTRTKPVGFKEKDLLTCWTAHYVARYAELNLLESSLYRTLDENVHISRKSYRSERDRKKYLQFKGLNFGKSAVPPEALARRELDVFAFDYRSFGKPYLVESLLSEEPSQSIVLKNVVSEDRAFHNRIGEKNLTC